MARERAVEVALLEGKARSIEVTRLVVFVVGAVVGLLREQIPAPEWLSLTVAGGAGIGFVYLIVRHREVRAALRRAKAALLLAASGAHRRDRDFAALEEAYEEYGFVDPLLDPLAGDVPAREATHEEVGHQVQAGDDGGVEQTHGNTTGAIR